MYATIRNITSTLGLVYMIILCMRYMSNIITNITFLLLILNLVCMMILYIHYIYDTVTNITFLFLVKSFDFVWMIIFCKIYVYNITTNNTLLLLVHILGLVCMIISYTIPLKINQVLWSLIFWCLFEQIDTYNCQDKNSISFYSKLKFSMSKIHTC